ncbi:MAG: hypothetical protein IJN64_12990 [Lachnospiraceae bacterium]|nr:hypothetical protein [Lachnospiraceae bacterium]
MGFNMRRKDREVTDFEYNRATVEYTAVIRLKVTEYFGKINPVSNPAE